MQLFIHGLGILTSFIADVPNLNEGINDLHTNKVQVYNSKAEVYAEVMTGVMLDSEV